MKKYWLSSLLMIAFIITVTSLHVFAVHDPEMVAAVDPSLSDDSGVRGLINVQGNLYLVANDGVHGFELWKSDGTEAGTVMIKDIHPGADGSKPRIDKNAVIGNEFFFAADDGTHGDELWKSDGTEEGTVMVKDINPIEGANIFGYAVLNNELYFEANDNVHGEELWKSDGTEEGTVMVRDIYQTAAGDVSGGSNPQGFMVMDGNLYFVASDVNNQDELWKTDGTETGTVPVKTINNTSSAATRLLGVIDHTLYFKADDGTHGTELWESDGTKDGTVMVKDIYAGPNGSDVRGIAELNGYAYFAADDGIHGVELWKSDGTEESTVMVKDVNPVLGSDITTMVTVGGFLYFSPVNDGTNGVQLWKSDGTEAGTVMIKDIYPGGAAKATSIQGLANINGTLYFSAGDSDHGRELWKSDGTTDGTVLVDDINPGSGDGDPTVGGTVIDDVFYFTAKDGVHSRELWKIDLSTPRPHKPSNSVGVVGYIAWGCKDTSALNWNQFGKDAPWLCKYPTPAPAPVLAPTASSSGTVVIKPGMSTDDIRKIQRILIRAGYSVIADGNPSQKTKDAMVKFQQSGGKF